MGHIITELAARDEDVQIVAGVDAAGTADADFPVYRSLPEVKEQADVIVDFSTARAADSLITYCMTEKMPVVLCTTGLSVEQLRRLNEAAGIVPVLRSSNMSIGINLIEQILAEAAPKLAAAGFDCEIVEKHHRHKLDAPSGTAISLADAVNDSCGGDYDYVYDRSGRREERPEKEIGISSVRGGSIVGDHDVIFAGEDEVITFSHRAYSRAIFGKGALQAAKFLAGRKPGMYSMKDVLA